MASTYPVCNECYDELEGHMEDRILVDDVTSEQCILCNTRAANQALKPDDLPLTREALSRLNGEIHGCETNWCARVWDSVDKEWAFDDTNSTVLDLIQDTYDKFEPPLYARLLALLSEAGELDLISPRGLCCRACGVDIESVHASIRERSWRRISEPFPKPPAELEELPYPTHGAGQTHLISKH